MARKARRGRVIGPRAERLAERGTIGGNIYKGDDGRVYFRT